MDRTLTDTKLVTTDLSFFGIQVTLNTVVGNDGDQFASIFTVDSESNIVLFGMKIPSVIEIKLKLNSCILEEMRLLENVSNVLDLKINKFFRPFRNDQLFLVYGVRLVIDIIGTRNFASHIDLFFDCRKRSQVVINLF